MASYISVGMFYGWLELCLCGCGLLKLTAHQREVAGRCPLLIRCDVVSSFVDSERFS